MVQTEEGVLRVALIADSEIPVTSNIAEDYVMGIPQDCFRRYEDGSK